MTQASPIGASAPSLFLTPTDIAATYPGIPLMRRRDPLVRRPTPQQGIALEILGHAIEYLVDSNFYHQRADVPGVKEAIAILKQSNREVFAGAPEVMPARTLAGRWIQSHLRLRAPASPTLLPASTRLMPVKR